jgi:hypothetical protein
MEVKMQTSFIPKKPIIESTSSSSGVSLFLLLSIILFIVAVALAGGVWLWQKSLVAQIEKDKVDLAAVKDSYEEGTIKPLIRLNDRIEESKNLLANHIAVHPVFVLLEENVIQNVQLKTFKFSAAGNNKINLELSGIARNYDALSKQSDAFGAPHLRDYISEPVISDFSLNLDGTVAFNFKALINSDLISYEKVLEKAQ